MDLIFIKPREPDPAPPPPRRKHVMTPARLAAARANAQKSSGPKDTTKSRFNNLRHGCCCELPVVMPGESAEAVQDKLNIYITQQGAKTEQGAKRATCSATLPNGGSAGLRAPREPSTTSCAPLR